MQVRRELGLHMRAAVRKPRRCPCTLHTQPYAILSPKKPAQDVKLATLKLSNCEAAYQPPKAFAAGCPADVSAKAASKWRPSKFLGAAAGQGHFHTSAAL